MRIYRGGSDGEIAEKEAQDVRMDVTCSHQGGHEIII